MVKPIVKSTKNTLLQELHKNQLTDIPTSKKLQYNDFKRIVKNIDISIFNHDECCMWKGYITNINKPEKGVYINFYFRDKKIALHRLLYSNYIGHLNDDEYLKFSCHNHGKCCNINHLKKYKYNDNENLQKSSKQIDTSKNKTDNSYSKSKKHTNNIQRNAKDDIDNIIIYFE